MEAVVKKNHKYWMENGEVKSAPCSPEELEAERKSASPFIEAAAIGVRSCWECNTSHSRFLQDGPNKDGRDYFVFMCFECGRYFFNCVDITRYR
jgi:hypothetical protein